MTWVAGVDAFKRGWFVVLCDLKSRAWVVRRVRTFVEVTLLAENPAVITVDMPIGLLDFTPAGGRDCERIARSLLKGRASSVFSSIGRKALEATSHGDAHSASIAGGGIGIPAQSWGLAAKLREVDAVMTPAMQSRIYEVHPELCFAAMNNDKPMEFAKRNGAGENERVDILQQVGMPSIFLTEQLASLGS